MKPFDLPPVPVLYTPGDGHWYVVVVAYMTYDFPRGPDRFGTCAFCHGDPCNDDRKSGTHIAIYYERNPRAETCPMCKGRPT